MLSRREITVYPKPGEPLGQIMVTYTAAGLPPATITLTKEKYTQEIERAAIKEDIIRRLKEKPETFKV